MRRVAIVGAGWAGFRPQTPELSFRELVYEAATRAYEEAGIDPRSDVDAFVSCQEDYWEGIAIADEFAPEPLGAVLRPTYTVAGDGLQGLAQAYMMIKSGAFDVVVVESHAKPSDIVTLDGIYDLALDPLHVRPLGVGNPLFTAGMDAVAYMSRTGVSRLHLAMVAAANKRMGLSNPRAPHAARIAVDDVLESPYYIYPMTRYEVAPFTDAAVVMVLASDEAARRITDSPVWLDGVGWATEVGTGAIEFHEWGRMPSIRAAALMAYQLAGIDSPAAQTGFAEVEDRFSFMELLALEELGVAGEGEAARMLERGDLAPGAFYPVNQSGGSLSAGVTLEVTGLWRALEAYLELRDNADAYDQPRALVASWRGPPTYTSAVAVLSAL